MGRDGGVGDDVSVVFVYLSFKWEDGRVILWVGGVVGVAAW